MNSSQPQNFIQKLREMSPTQLARQGSLLRGRTRALGVLCIFMLLIGLISVIVNSPGGQISLWCAAILFITVGQMWQKINFIDWTIEEKKHDETEF